MNIAFTSSHPLATFKRRLLKKLSTIHGKTLALEPLFSLLVLFFKKETPAEVFSREFFRLFDKNYFIELFRGCCFSDFRIYLNKAKTFWKLIIKQTIFWCPYYDIWTYFYVMYLTRRVRSLMESFFVKFQVFPANRILLTTVLLWKKCAIFLLEKSQRFYSRFVFS